MHNRPKRGRMQPQPNCLLAGRKRSAKNPDVEGPRTEARTQALGYRCLWTSARCDCIFDILRKPGSENRSILGPESHLPRDAHFRTRHDCQHPLPSRVPFRLISHDLLALIAGKPRERKMRTDCRTKMIWTGISSLSGKFVTAATPAPEFWCAPHKKHQSEGGPAIQERGNKQKGWEKKRVKVQRVKKGESGRE